MKWMSRALINRDNHIAALEARVRELEAALRPFAKEAERFTAYRNDVTLAVYVVSVGLDGELTVGALKAALAALRQQGAGAEQEAGEEE